LLAASSNIVPGATSTFLPSISISTMRFLWP
jgi:hypothetical protein